VVDDQGLAVGVGERELFVAELERPDLGMVDPGRAAAPRAGVVARLEPAKALAAHRELADETGVAAYAVDPATPVACGRCRWSSSV
jgi:hypothetical protein